MAKLLVVEDEPMITDLIKMVLEHRGYEIIHTADGSKAVEMIAEQRPQLVLLDVMLPGLDGYSIQNKLLENEELRNIPVIIITSKSQIEELFQLGSNVAGFIAKPFTVKEVTEKINEVLSNWQKS